MLSGTTTRYSWSSTMITWVAGAVIFEKGTPGEGVSTHLQIWWVTGSGSKHVSVEFRPNCTSPSDQSGKQGCRFLSFSSCTTIPSLCASVAIAKVGWCRYTHPLVKYYRLLQAYAGRRLSKTLHTGSADVKPIISMLCLRPDHHLVPVCRIISCFR